MTKYWWNDTWREGGQTYLERTTRHGLSRDRHRSSVL